MDNPAKEIRAAVEKCRKFHNQGTFIRGEYLDETNSPIYTQVDIDALETAARTWQPLANLLQNSLDKYTLPGVPGFMGYDGPSHAVACAINDTKVKSGTKK